MGQLLQKLNTLLRKRAACRRLAEQATQTHLRLLLKNTLLHAWCQVLAVVGQCVLPTRVQHEGCKERLQQLLADEATLLQELNRADTLAAQRSNHLALPAPEPTSLSGRLDEGDPMAFLRRTLSLGAPLPEAHHLTSLQLAALLRETVLQCNLHMLQRGRLPLDSDDAEGEVQELWDRYMRLLVSLMLVGRQHVAAEVCSFNLATLEFKPEHAAASEAATAALPPRIGLTEHQQTLMSIGAETCDSLAEQLRVQWHALKGDMQAAGVAADATAAAAKAAAAAAGGQGVTLTPDAPQAAGRGSGLSSMSGVESLAQRREHLEQQQQQLAQLTLLLHKESTLSLVLVTYAVGLLTYRQLSHMFVLAWPYSVNLPTLAQHTHALRAKATPRRQAQAHERSPSSTEQGLQQCTPPLSSSS